MIRISVRKMLLVALFSVGMLVPVFGASQVQAQDEATPNMWIQVAPVSKRLDLSPSKQYDGSLKVTNIGTEQFDFRVYASDYYVHDMDYEPIYENSPRSQIARWVTFDRTDFQGLSPNESIDVQYHINVPADVPSGSQYAVLFAETVNKGQSASTAIQTINRVGSLLFADMGGETRQFGEIVSLNQDKFFANPPISSGVVVKNTGNVDFSAHHTVVFKSVFGDKEIYRNSIDKVVFPDTSREIKQDWEDAPWVGLFRVENEVSVLGDNQKDSQLVLVAPLWLIVAILIVLVLIVMIIVRMIVVGVKNRRRVNPRKFRGMGSVDRENKP